MKKYIAITTNDSQDVEHCKQKVRVRFHIPFSEHSFRKGGGWGLGIQFHFKSSIISDDYQWQWNDRTLVVWLFGWRFHVHLETDIRPSDLGRLPDGFAMREQAQEEREAQ